MSSLMTMMTAFGLAGGAGAKAFVPLLILGGFHYTPYFELSGRFAWIAAPPVMIVLGVLLVLEILVDSVPELGEYSDIVSYLPKAVTGFLAFAAATGTIDDNLASLSVSGVLGAGTAASVHWLRNRIRRPIREVGETLHEGVGRLASVGEAGASTLVSGTAILAPPLAITGLGVLLMGGVFAVRGLDRRRKQCPSCGHPVQKDALACPSCGESV